METVIIGGKQYQQNAHLHSYKKRLLLYNKDGEIFIYKKKYGIYIPSIVVSDDIIFEDSVKRKVPFDFEKENVEQLIKTVSYDIRYQTVNNKLIKKNLQFVREYYSCLAKFDKKTESELEPFITLSGDILTPKIMYIEEAIQYLKRLKIEYSSDKMYALETLKEKVKVYEK